MPNNSNAIGSLEVLQAPNSAGFATALNDRMRRISDLLTTLTTAAANSSTPAAAGSGGAQVVLCVGQTLGVESDAGPAFQLADATAFSNIQLLLKSAPVGGSVTVQLYVAGAAWGPAISIAPAAKSASAAYSGTIAAAAPIRVDLTAVGTTFPGSDLTVILS